MSLGKLNVNAYKLHGPLRTSVVRADYSVEQAISELSEEQKLKMRSGPPKATSNSERLGGKNGTSPVHTKFGTIEDSVTIKTKAIVMLKCWFNSQR